jgi:hypothetical protein
MSSAHARSSPASSKGRSTGGIDGDGDTELGADGDAELGSVVAVDDSALTKLLCGTVDGEADATAEASPPWVWDSNAGARERPSH